MKLLEKSKKKKAWLKMILQAINSNIHLINHVMNKAIFW